MYIKLALLHRKHTKIPEDITLSYDELKTSLTNFTKGSKEESRAYIAGQFGGRERHTNNLHSKNLIILDLDTYNGPINDLEAILKRDLAPYKVIAHSTASHASNKPRIRIVLFLANEIETCNYKMIATNFINKLSPELKASIDFNASTTANKLLYFPTYLDDNYEKWVWEQEGALIEPTIYEIENGRIPLDPLLLATRQYPLNNITEENIITYLKTYPANETSYHEWLEVGLALHHQYEGKEEGLKLWNKWSQADKRIKENGDTYYPGLDHLTAKWKSINNSSNPRTFATIIHRINEKTGKKKKENDIPLPLSKDKWVDVKGKYLNIPLFTEANFKILLKEYKIEIKFDVIKKKLMILLNNVKYPNINQAIIKIKLLCRLNHLETGLVNEAIHSIGIENEFNSWKEWVESKKWDGINRLPEFYETVETNSEYIKLKEIYLNKWLLQMIHVTCVNDEDRPKVARMVLTFQGTTFKGKTSWLSGLVPPFMHDYTLTGLILDTSKDTSIKKFISHIFVELGELAATYKKSDIESLKNIISAPVDVLDIKYIPHAEEHRRRTVFLATVNETNFLQDQTGNSRFLCLPVISCNGYHHVHMQQLYAQLLVHAKANPNENYNLTDEEITLQTEINSGLESISVLQEKFEEKFNLEVTEYLEGYNATQVLEILNIPLSLMAAKKSLVNDMAKILDKMGFERKRNPRGWLLPPLRFPKEKSNAIEEF